MMRAGGPRSHELIPARNPGQAAEFDAFFGQSLGFFFGGLAVDAALVAFAVMNLARLLGELVADVLAVLLDMLADFDECLAQFLRHVSLKRRHLLLLRRRHWRRHPSRSFDGLLLAALAQARRHRRALDFGVAANRAADQQFLLLALVGLAVLEPAF